MSEEQTNYKTLRAVAAMQINENKDRLKEMVNEFVNSIIDSKAKSGNLEYFEIRISNHQGNLFVEDTTKYKKKVY